MFFWGTPNIILALWPHCQTLNHQKSPENPICSPNREIDEDPMHCIIPSSKWRVRWPRRRPRTDLEVFFCLSVEISDVLYYMYIAIYIYITILCMTVYSYIFIYTLILRTISRRGERRCVLEIHSTYVGWASKFFRDRDGGVGKAIKPKPPSPSFV